MLAALGVAAALSFSPALVPGTATPVRTTTPVAMSAPNTRRDALLGLAAASFAGLPAVASAAKVPSIFDERKDAQYNGPQGAAKKCTGKGVSKPCADGAGIKWDAKLYGLKAAETRTCETHPLSPPSHSLNPLLTFSAPPIDTAPSHAVPPSLWVDFPWATSRWTLSQSMRPTPLTSHPNILPSLLLTLHPARHNSHAVALPRSPLSRPCLHAQS